MTANVSPDSSIIAPFPGFASGSNLCAFSPSIIIQSVLITIIHCHRYSCGYILYFTSSQNSQTNRILCTEKTVLGRRMVVCCEALAPLRSALGEKFLIVGRKFMLITSLYAIYL